MSTDKELHARERERAELAWRAFHTDIEIAELGEFHDLPNEDQIRWQAVAYALSGVTA